VICLSDEIALGVLTAAEELGIAVPGDLVVTGFDDIPEAGPAGLTTVRQPAARKGETAWRLLDREDVSQELLPYQLVVRSSTPTVDHVNRE
jgi:DNA-binding LacI/PurR family transcriptional regulator